MSKKFNKTLFGFKPDEVNNEIEKIDREYQQKIENLETEIEKSKMELLSMEEKRIKLQSKLDDYEKREHLITEVMLTAQINAQKIDEQARERARTILSNSEEELKNNLHELDLLRIKVARFKEEFREVLDNYRVSLEKVKEVPDDAGFIPKLVSKEKESEEVKKKEILS